MSEYIRREQRPDGDVRLLRGLRVCSLGKRFPALLEFLTLGEWEPGVAREFGSVLVFVGEGRLKAMLNDKDAARVAFVSGDSLESVLCLLEEGLKDNDLDWRWARENGGGRARKSS